MENGIKICLSVFELYILYRYMTIFFGNQVHNKKITVGVYILRFILGVVYHYIEFYPLATIFISIMANFLITLCYKSRISKKIITTVVIYICTCIAEFVTALIIGLQGFNFFSKITQGDIFTQIIIELVSWAITLVIRHFKQIGKNMPAPKAFFAAVIVVPITSIYLEVMIFQQSSINNEIAGTSLICVVVSNFLLIYLYDSLSKMFQEQTKAAIVRKEKEYYHEQLEMLKEKNEELRQFRHDLKNRMVTMQQMLLDKQYDNLEEYIENISEKISCTELYSNTGNVAIDSVINYKLTNALREGIEVNVNISIPPNISIDEDDIIVILGNAIDNAVEANEKLSEGRYIKLEMEYDRGCIYICVKNRYDSFLRLYNGRILTRKENIHLHGIGLESMESVVKKYHGVLDIEYGGREFALNILLYI